MTALSSYSTGTVAVSADGTAVTGASAIWASAGNVKPGDLFQSGHFCVPITDVVGDTHLTITPWPGAALSGAPYVIWKVSQQRIVGETYARDVDKMVGALNTSGFFVFVDIDATAPDPSLGDDGQYAFQPTTGKTWSKVAGAWSYLGVYKAFNLRGAYDNAATYSYGDVQTTAGSAYVYISAAPSSGHAAPNATYWQLLAAKGDPGLDGEDGGIGPTGPGYGGTSATSLAIGPGSKPFTTQAGLAYTNGARVRATATAGATGWLEGVATYSGTTLTIASDAISGSGTGTAWNFNVAGEPGAGSVSSVNGQTGAVVLAFETKARVTLTSGVAVTESDVTGASSVYVTPAGHNFALIYDGTNDVPKSYSEILVTLDTTNALSGKNFDIFMAVSGGNVVAGYGPAWTAGAVAGSDTARGTGAGSTELEVFHGRLVNKNAITLRNASGTTYAIAARQANLVGGFRTTANGLTEDSRLKRFVWSVNSTLRAGSVTESATTWTYSTATARQANGNAANQIEYLQGLGGSVVKAYAYSVAFNSTSTVRGCTNGIGIDSTSINSATLIGFGHVDTFSRPMNSAYEGSPGLGYHKLVWLEQGAGSDTQTWYGTSGSVIKTGMTAEFVM